MPTCTPSRLAFLFAAALSCFASLARAQDNCTGAPVPVPIHVTDTSDAALGHAAVEARCGANVFNGITDDHGDLRIALPPGRYLLTARLPGFSDTTQSGAPPQTASPSEVGCKVSRTREP